MSHSTVISIHVSKKELFGKTVITRIPSPRLAPWRGQYSFTVKGLLLTKQGAVFIQQDKQMPIIG